MLFISVQQIFFFFFNTLGFFGIQLQGFLLSTTWWRCVSNRLEVHYLALLQKEIPLK